MARADDGTDCGRGVEAGTSDARLSELLHANTADAYSALQELRARHRAAVLAYARLCTSGESAARQLAAQAFTLTARETGRGIEPRVPWRHQLLLTTWRLAASWATGERAVGLDSGLLLVLNAAGTAGPAAPMLAAYESIASRTQGLIWYALVDREPVERTAGFLGLTREDVTYGVDQALHQLGQACLRSRLAASTDPDCRDFRRLIEESVRPDSPRDSADLHAHMAHCPHCTAAYEELSALHNAPRTALAEGLLPWAGSAYVADDPSGEWDDDDLAAAATWPPYRRRAVLVSAALGVALAPLAFLLLSQGGASPSRDPVSSVGTPVTPPTVSVTVTETVSASPSPSLSSKSPSPSRTSAPARTSRPKAPPSPTPSPTHPPNSTYAQVVNVGSGLCLDVAGAFFNGTDVVTTPCTASRTQRWRVDSARGVLQSYADPDYCLDSRGSTDRGVGIWTCASVEGRNGQNLKFVVDDDGAIRPAIAIETAVTPENGGDWVSLESLNGDREQRWRAGAA
ncbi:ricin-type beta-trefoil lectin domain protein [Streptomyces sp. HUAS ZL42]|uniref:ricin-type beta-trefoil lectin domain protein n=1 Tax=Streptomyces sp. HUAS ZL42 TaxID=3231715 RepID=UPI00345E8B19